MRPGFTAGPQEGLSVGPVPAGILETAESITNLPAGKGIVITTSAPTVPHPGHPSGRDTGAVFLMAGGVPGAGKSTLLRRIEHDIPGLTVLDPERRAERLAAALPPGLPYRWYRPLVHLMHTLDVVRTLLAGPHRSEGPVAVHDTATRRRRRDWTARLARRRGWTPVLVFLDVPRDVARAGQHARGRVVNESSFARHWHRWTALRPHLTREDDAPAGGPWDHVVVTTRDDAKSRVFGLLTQDGTDRCALGGGSPCAQ
ncbi:putative ATP/GTP binding protein [Rhodococcus aetherivorans]|uniref:ATP/GTP binding protein n=2 Tax=Rhodococcus aetherivorans TaxID=191292 RepID=A0ABQ0YNN0_9NOCA|nr:putative ATP/GTP binding protein [Rhodococcus aetherivorans]